MSTYTVYKVIRGPLQVGNKVRREDAALEVTALLPRKKWYILEHEGLQLPVNFTENIDGTRWVTLDLSQLSPSQKRRIGIIGFDETDLSNVRKIELRIPKDGYQIAWILGKIGSHETLCIEYHPGEFTADSKF